MRGASGERGQVILVIALGVFSVMLGASAMALDWGNSLLQKQRLQNVADAASLAAAQEISRGRSIADAVAVAQSIVSSNTGGALTLAYPGTGTGSGLTDGLELSPSTGEARVALSRQVGTMIAPVLGVNSIGVAARSRAIVGPYGVLPVTVKRFSDGNTAYDLGESGNPEQVVDYISSAYSAPSTPRYISSWPSPLSASPAAPAGDTLPDAHDPQVSGPVFAFVGRQSSPNVANSSDFHFFVAPDVRNITAATPTFYNGITQGDLTSTQILKNVTSGYILSRGYPGPNPTVGEQLGTFSGAPTDQAVEAMKKTYKRGDVVTAMVYDGTVYRKPSFDLRVDSAIKTSSSINITPPPPPPVLPAPGSPITFQVTLTPVNNFASTSGVQFSATGLEGWADWKFESGGLNSPYNSGPVSGGALTLTFSISATTEVQGARTAVIRAFDAESGTTRTVTASVVVGSIPAFSVSSGEAYRVVEQGSSTRFDLDLKGWNGYPTTDVAVSQEWVGGTPAAVTVSTPSTVRVRDGFTASLRVNVDAGSGATTGEWTMRIRLTDPNDASRSQAILLTVQIIPASTNPTVSLTTSFVKVLGYANFRITYANNASSPSPSLDSNTVYAYAVSGLVADPRLLGLGMTARLVPWR